MPTPRVGTPAPRTPPCDRHRRWTRRRVSIRRARKIAEDLAARGRAAVGGLAVAEEKAKLGEVGLWRCDLDLVGRDDHVVVGIDEDRRQNRLGGVDALI